MVVRIAVIGFKADKSYIDVCDTEEQLKNITVLQLRRTVQAHFDYEGEDLRLIFGSKCLIDDHLLSDCGIKHMSTIYVVNRAAPCCEICTKRGALQKLTDLRCFQMGSCSSCSKCSKCSGEDESTQTAADPETVGMVAGAGATGGTVSIVTTWRKEEMIIDLCDQEQFQNFTVEQLKKKIVERLTAAKPKRAAFMSVYLSFNDKELKEGSALLSECGIQHMSVIDILSIAQCCAGSMDVVCDY